MAGIPERRALRRATAPAVTACLLVLAASAGAQTASETASAEAVGIADETIVLVAPVVSLGEGIGVGDGTGSLAGEQVAVGEGIGVGDGHATREGQVAAIAEGIAVDDGTDALSGRIVALEESIAVDDGTEVERSNAPPIVLLAPLSGEEGSPTAGTGSFADPDSTSWTGTVDWGDGTPPEPLALEPDKTFALSHVYDDDGAYLLTVTVEDDDGAVGTSTAPVTIANVAPTAALGGGPGLEGSPVTIAFTDQLDPSAADTAAGFTYRYACDGATLGPETGSDTVECTFDDDGAYTVLGRIADKDGGFTDYAAEVVVENVAPDGELANGGPVNEGTPVTIAWTGVTDPSAADTAAGFTFRYACDGATLGPETADPTTTCTFDDGPATHVVLARVADKDGGFTDRTTEVVVQNVAPDGTLGNDGPVGEGSAVTVSWSDQHDPSAADTAAGFTYRYACDGSTLGPETSEPTATCTFDDGPAEHVVLARIADKDGGVTDRTTTVAVLNLPPTATLANDGPVDEGSPVTIAFSEQADPSAADTAAGFTYRYACDGVVLGPPTASPAALCAFDDGPSAHTVLARITDKDGGSTDLTTEVVVRNVAPTATLVLPAAPVDEGSTFELALADVHDPSAADTAAGFTVEFDCGTGAGFAAEATCVAVNDPSQAVRARITDKDGGATVIAGDVAVANVAPAVTITGPPSGAVYRVGEAATFTGTFTDPGVEDVHTAVWTLGAAEHPGTVAQGAGSGSVSLTTSFSQAGVYSVRLTVTDDSGGSGTATTVDGLSAFVVVYDPSAGFVTGGGWIDSPPGASSAQPTASGRATFGFEVKYRPGTTVPHGKLEFRLQPNRFAFRATDFDWLVVSGSWAQARGEGTVGGAPGYGFLLTVYDGKPDRLRLKVWNAAGDVVYDNRRGAPDSPDTAEPQPLGGGSIVIHAR